LSVSNVRFAALSFFFLLAKLMHVVAGIIKLQQMNRWNVFWDTVYMVCFCFRHSS